MNKLIEMDKFFFFFFFSLSNFLEYRIYLWDKFKVYSLSYKQFKFLFLLNKRERERELKSYENLSKFLIKQFYIIFLLYVNICEHI